MRLNLDAWVYSKLNASPTLAGKIVFFYPNDFTILPKIAYSTEQTASDMDYQDDINNYADCIVTIDVYTVNGTDDFTISQAIDTVLTGAGFTIQASMPVPDTDAKTQHLHMEYGRRGISPGDLV